MKSVSCVEALTIAVAKHADCNDAGQLLKLLRRLDQNELIFHTNVLDRPRADRRHRSHENRAQYLWRTAQIHTQAKREHAMCGGLRAWSGNHGPRTVRCSPG